MMHDKTDKLKPIALTLEQAEEITQLAEFNTIIDVDADCNITYYGGRVNPCQYRPSFTFTECAPGYGPGGHCPKYDHYHLMGRRKK